MGLITFVKQPKRFMRSLMSQFDRRSDDEVDSDHDDSMAVIQNAILMEVLLVHPNRLEVELMMISKNEK